MVVLSLPVLSSIVISQSFLFLEQISVAKDAQARLEAFSKVNSLDKLQEQERTISQLQTVISGSLFSVLHLGFNPLIVCVIRNAETNQDFARRRR